MADAIESTPPPPLVLLLPPPPSATCLELLDDRPRLFGRDVDPPPTLPELLAEPLGGGGGLPPLPPSWSDASYSASFSLHPPLDMADGDSPTAEEADETRSLLSSARRFQ